MIEAIREYNHSLEKEFDIPEGFLDKLAVEDDWSFVIKSHALLEAILTQGITYSLSRPDLNQIISNLEMSNFRVGKMAIAEALGLINTKDKLFLQKLSELRNDLAHKINKICFKFTSHYESLDKNQKKHSSKHFLLLQKQTLR